LLATHSVSVLHCVLYTLYTTLFFSQYSAPPLPLPFPYTTLFRSLAPGAPPYVAGRGGSSYHPNYRPSRRGEKGGRRRTGTPHAQDRESTRLKSSHRPNTDSVFFFEKNTQTHTIAKHQQSTPSATR